MVTRLTDTLVNVHLAVSTGQPRRTHTGEGAAVALTGGARCAGDQVAPVLNLLLAQVAAVTWGEGVD